MFLEAIILGVIMGFIRNGNLRNISVTKIRGWFLIIIAFILQIITILNLNISIIQSYGKYFYALSAAMLIIVILVNLDKKGMYIILIGAILNFIVIFMNGFKMPVYFEGLKLAGMQNMIDGIKNGNITNYMSLSDVTNWTKHLGKYIVIPKPYPLAKVISVGDIFMSLGVIFFIQGEMLKSYLTMKGRMIRMGYKTKL